MKIKIFDTLQERFEYFDVILTDKENVLYQNGMNIEEILNERDTFKIENVIYASGFFCNYPVEVEVSGNFKVNGNVTNMLKCPVYSDNKHNYFFVCQGKKILLTGTDYTGMKPVPWEAV